jgi:hypothetical protein
VRFLFFRVVAAVRVCDGPSFVATGLRPFSGNIDFPPADAVIPAGIGIAAILSAHG